MKVLFFDGHCNLCNHTVNWLVKIDQRKRIQFASLQGSTAKELLLKTGLVSSQKANSIATQHDLNSEPSDPESVIYYQNNVIFDRSTAILRCLTDIGGFYSYLAMALMLIPRSLRDILYALIARHRYKIFGRRDTCRLPTESEKNRFLD